MPRYLRYILPIGLLLAISLQMTGLLHIGLVQIKTFELKWTELDYDYYPTPGDIFTTAEIVSNDYNYEDGIFRLRPDYDDLLCHDALEIAGSREDIDSINAEQLTFYTKDYVVRTCIDQCDIRLRDSTITKSLADVEILGAFYLFDREECELLMEPEGKRFRIRDRIVFKGVAPDELMDNKIKEIYISQLTDQIPKLISRFEAPFINRQKRKIWRALYAMRGMDFGDLTDNRISYSIWLMDRAYRTGSATYGHRSAPDYPTKIRSEHISSAQKTAIDDDK